MGMFDRKNGATENKTPNPPESNAPPTAAEITPKPKVIERHKSDFEKSADEVEAARDGRNISDIPLNDKYWEIQNAHMIAHGAHEIRTDVTESIKGRPLTEEEKGRVVK